jgi:hypothetical protein
VTSSLDQVGATQTSHSRMQESPVLANHTTAGEPTLARESFVERLTLGDWRQRYARHIWTTDLLGIVSLICGTQIAWFGLGNAQVAMGEDFRIAEKSCWRFSGALVLVWMIAHSRSHRVMGSESLERVRVVDASIRLFGLVATAAFLFRVEARGFLLISLPVGVFVLIAVRWARHQWLVQVHRRFLEKLGITGMWQVSGRSIPSWENTVRDLSCVENWSLIGGLGILAKTAQATLLPSGTSA